MAPTPHAPLRRAHVSRRAARPLIALAAVLATLISLVGVAGPASASVPPRTAAERTFANAVLSVLNQERAAHGLRALQADYRLRLSARRHNVTMASYNTLSHQLPGEMDFARRISATGYRWTYAGENIGWNSTISTRGVVALEKMMYNEKAPNDGHRQNILSRNYRNVGVDVYVDSRHHKVWLTTDFARS